MEIFKTTKQIWDEIPKSGRIALVVGVVLSVLLWSKLAFTLCHFYR